MEQQNESPPLLGIVIESTFLEEENKHRHFGSAVFYSHAEKGVQSACERTRTRARGGGVIEYPSLVIGHDAVSHCNDISIGVCFVEGTVQQPYGLHAVCLPEKQNMENVKDQRHISAHYDD